MEMDEDAALRYQNVVTILEQAHLGALSANCMQQKIDSVDLCLILDDKSLERLGIVTIGDRVRFRDAVHRAKVSSQPMTTTSPPTTVATLFRPSTSSGHSRGTKAKKKIRTWTCTFVCLANKDMDYCPSSSIKAELQKAGLGQKRIQFMADDKSFDVRQKLMSNIGYPKLSSGGGFELLTCQSNCRKLKVISCIWDIKSLKSCIGNQTKIYIRPIQENLDTRHVLDPVEEASNERLKERCRMCFQDIYVDDLREHIKNCSDRTELQSLNETAGNGVTSAIEESANDTQLELLRPEPIRPTNRYEAEVNVHVEDIHVQDDTLPDFEEQEIELHLNETESIHVAVEKTTAEVSSITPIANSCISFCKRENLSDPTEILRYIQLHLVTGRKLDLESVSSTVEGETNFICVDRVNLLETAFEEISVIADLRKTLEVQFYNETAVDLGGPRKEFFALVLREIMDKYFDPVREVSQDYIVIGKIMALSLLQNGKLPKLLNPELLEEVFCSTSPRKFVEDLRQGLDGLGLFQIVSQLPSLMHFFTAGHVSKLTLKMLINLLKPNFSPEGSNRRTRESRVYSKFLKYLREASGGRRPVACQAFYDLCPEQKKNLAWDI